MPSSPVYSRSTNADPYAADMPYTAPTATDNYTPAYSDQGSGQVTGARYTGGPIPEGYTVKNFGNFGSFLVPIAGYAEAHGYDPKNPEGANPQYLQDIRGVLGAAENAQVRKALLTSDIYGGNDPLSRQYGKLNAIQAAQERYPGVIAGAVQAHHQMKDAQAWQLYMMQLQHQWEKENQPKHNYWNDVLEYGGAAVGAAV